MKQLFLFFVIGMSLMACNNSKPEQDLTIAPLKSSTTDTTINATSTTETLPQQMPAIPNNTVGTAQTNMPQSVPTGTTAAGMNPEHGKPGHKCEIAVGAPLNSAPVKTAIAPATITQPTTISQPAITQPAKTITAKGMNPAHGEPGHRCDISVGAPLNSTPTNSTKPAAVNGATNITPMSTATQNSSIIPALQNTSISIPAKTASAFTGKINPAHGQPGHDCKVAVGQPLP